MLLYTHYISQMNQWPCRCLRKTVYRCGCDIWDDFFARNQHQPEILPLTRSHCTLAKYGRKKVSWIYFWIEIIDILHALMSIVMLNPYIYGLACKFANYIFINYKTTYIWQGRMASLSRTGKTLSIRLETWKYHHPGRWSHTMSLPSLRVFQWMKLSGSSGEG